jgi:intracellular sulfur oxidation DsrE/DsrF family protein
MKQLLAASALAAAAALGIASTPCALADATAASKPVKKYQLVFHVSENSPGTWQVALNNALSFQRNVGKENVDLEIVANGPGLNMLKLDSKAADRIAQALERNIDLVACGETMKATRVDKSDLIPGVRIVPGGLIEIVDRQRSGWTYIRP